MKICIISKYPPIEGGVSSGIYWLARGLGELNHKVHVVTNCMEVEGDYREEILENKPGQFEPKNVRVHSTACDTPFFIPSYNPYIPKLVNIAIEVIRKYDIDLIYSEYLMPYGVAGLMAKYITKKPFMVAHAGSDITRLFDSPSLKSLFIEIFKGADKISATQRHSRKILRRCKISRDKFIIGLRRSIDLKAFHPDVKPFDMSLCLRKNKKEKIPTFLYIGKVSKLKRTFNFVDACSVIKKEEFRLIFVVGNNERSLLLRKHVHSKGLGEKAVFLPFQAPWRIPSLINSATCVVSPETSEEPYLPKNTHYPKIAREAMACGRCVVIGKGVAEKGVYRMLQDGVNSYIVDPDNTKEFARRLQSIVKSPDIAIKIGQEARRFSEKTEDFDESIQQWVMACKALLLEHSLKQESRLT